MEAIDASGVTGFVWRRVNPEREAEAEALMQELMALSHRYEGFLGSEVFPPIHGVQDAYVVLFRYDSGEHFRKWLESPERKLLLYKMETFLLEPAREFYFAHRRRAHGSATTVFSYCIKPGHEAEFADWRRRILEAVREWPGFLGTESFDTIESGKRPEFVVIVRFDTREHLDAWMNAPVRNEFMREVEAYVEKVHVRRVGSGFEGWFDTSIDRRPPVAWRQGMVILGALFPLIMILRHVLHPLFGVMPFPVAFLVLLTIDVTLLTYVIMPHFSRLMNFWLQPKPGSGWVTELLGWGVLLGMIAAALAATLFLGL